MRTLVWLQRELRIQNHPALESALANSSEVIVAYFHDPKQIVGAANSAWLSHSLQQLQRDYQRLKGQLWLIEGYFAEQLAALIQNHQIDQVYYTFQLGSPFSTLQQQALTVCKQQEIPLVPFNTENWLAYNQLLNGARQPYKVFTPFYKSLLTKLSLLTPFDSPITDLRKTAFVPCPSQHQTLPAELQTLSDQPWAKKVMQHWQVGENQAWSKLDQFVKTALNHYEIDRDFPAKAGTSLLSPHLHFGEIHPRAIVFALNPLDAQSTPASQIWLRQLAWREFARAILWHFPQSEHHPFQAKYEGFFDTLSDFDEQHHKIYQAWCNGETGIPIIDAGMKQLWETGWMHNRVRMLVASWLTKNAHLDWRLGVSWFNDTLVDADPANNTMGWQWVAGCGVDAAPYYRLFNPILQSKKFDAKGEYLKHWLPVLRDSSNDHLHQPLHNNKYHKPIVDLSLSRQTHLDRQKQLKTGQKAQTTDLTNVQ